MVLPVSFYPVGSHSTEFSSLVLEKECIGFQLRIFHFIILIFVCFFFSFFFPLDTKVLKCCCPASTEKELEWLILLRNGKTLFQVAIRKFLAVRRGVNSCCERATELGISTEVIIYGSAM